MAHWTAQVFVNSQVGRITANVEAATPGGAKQQIYAKYGNVQSITNLRQVNKNSYESSDDSEISFGSIGVLLGIVVSLWVFFTLTPWILMGLGGATGTWIGEKITNQTLDEYNERDDDLGHGKALITFALAILLGGFGFVKGTEIKGDFDKPTDSPPAKVQQAK